MGAECFRRRRFHEASLSLAAALSTIASDYVAAGMRLTVRQLYYQGVARGWFENSEREYQKIIRLLTDVREAGLFDWDAIEDRGREVVMRPCWSSPAEILEAAASSYHEDRWKLQDTRVIVVLEKSALAGILDPVCKDLDTPLLAARGYSSATLFYEIAKERICPAWDADQRVVILHLGDHDPSGLDMTRDLRARLSLYARSPVEVRRVPTHHRIRPKRVTRDSMRIAASTAKNAGSWTPCHPKNWHGLPVRPSKSISTGPIGRRVPRQSRKIGQA